MIYIYIFNCPHCNQTVTVKKTQLNCRIFRHGIYKHNFKQIDPHAPKDICDKLYKENKIYGCGKPFKFLKNHIHMLKFAIIFKIFYLLVNLYLFFSIS